MTNSLVTFNNQNLKLINHNNQLWLTSVDVAKALNYSDSNAITLLYSKHKAEFDEEMSQTIETIGSGNLLRKQRIFSREGAWLIGMFARTPKAAEFRKWVLKVLGAVADNQVAPVAAVDMKAIGGIVKKCAVVAVRDAVMDIMTAAEQPNFFREVSDDDLIRAIWGWYAGHHKKTVDSFRELNEENAELKRKLAVIKKTIN